MYKHEEDDNGGWSQAKAAPARGRQQQQQQQQQQPKKSNPSGGPAHPAASSASTLKRSGSSSSSSSSSSSYTTSSPSASSPSPYYSSSGRGRGQQHQARGKGSTFSSRGPSPAPTNAQEEKIFIPSCRASKCKQPARRKDWMRDLNSDDSSDDSLIHSSSDEDEDHDLARLTGKLHIPVADQDGEHDDVLPPFADNLDQIVKLKAACTLSRTGLDGLVAKGILYREDIEEIDGAAKVCKGNTQGFNSWEAMHAHARSHQDIYHTCIRRYLEKSKGVAPIRRQGPNTSSSTPTPFTAAPTDLEALYRSPSFPTPLKFANPPLVELAGLKQGQCNKAEIMQYMANVLLEIQEDTDGGCLVLSVHLKFGNGGKFMKRAAVELRTTNKGRAAAHCLLTRLPNTKVLHPTFDADAMRASYPRLYKKLHDD